MIGSQDSVHWRVCGQQLQSVHQGSVMRQRAGMSHDDFGRVASSVQDWQNKLFEKVEKQVRLLQSIPTNIQYVRQPFLLKAIVGR